MTVQAGAFIVLVIIGVVVFFRPIKKIAISTNTVTVGKDAAAPFVAAAVYMGWFSMTFNIVPGTVSFNLSRTLSVATPASVATTLTGGGFAMTDITGLAKGSGKMIVNATSAHGTHNEEKISITVT